MRKRYEELMDARAFNEWLQNRQLKQQGEEYLDAMGSGGREQSAGRCSGRPSSSLATPCRVKARPRVSNKAWKNSARSASAKGLSSLRFYSTSTKASP